MSSAPKLIFLTGAPPASSVNPATCTLDNFSSPFAKLLGRLDHDQTSIERSLNQAQSSSSSSLPSRAVWRSIPLARQPLHTGFSQPPGYLEFFTTASVSLDDDTSVSFGESSDGNNNSNIDINNGENDVLAQFCEQSLAAHNSIPSSQLDSFHQTPSLSAIDETSFITTSSTTNADLTTTTTTTTSIPPPLLANTRHLSDLEDIPPASRILALGPQTITLNLIVAVISIAQPRIVTTRWRRTLTLVEVLVSDETRSGFAVTFWLPAETAAESDVSKLRRQDVVLMENVALHVFRGKVYGQSLRRGLTKISLLWRRDGGGHYSSKQLTGRAALKHPQQEKTRQVKDWVINFVGRDPSTTITRRNNQKSWDKPPDDTQ